VHSLTVALRTVIYTVANIVYFLILLRISVNFIFERLCIFHNKIMQPLGVVNGDDCFVFIGVSLF